MSDLRIPALLALLLAGTACGSGGSRPAAAPVPEPAPSTADPPTRFFTLVEETEEGATHALRGSTRIAVDVNSAVHLDPNPEAFAAASGRALGADRDADLQRVEALTDSLRLARDLLRRLTEDLSTASSTISSVTAVLESAPDDKAAEASLRAALQLHAGILLPILDFLEARGYDLDSALATGDPAYDALGGLISGHVESLGDRLNGVLASMHQRRVEGGPRVQVWAVQYGRGRSPSQVHLEGYDELPAGNPRPVDKLSFAMTAAEQRRVETSHQLSREVLALAAQQRQLAARFRTDAESLRQLTRTELENLSRLLDSIPVAEELRTIRDGLTPELQAAIDRVESAVAPLQPLRAGHREVLQTLRASPSPTAPFAALGTLITQLEAARGALPADPAALRTELTAALTSLRTVASGALPALAAAQRARVERLVSQNLPRWEAAAARVTEIAQPYADAAQRADRIRQIVDLTRLSGSLADTELSPEQIQSHLISLSVDEVRPTTLDLTRIGPEEGDRVAVSVRVLDGITGTSLAQAEYMFALRTYGFHRRWSGGLGFAGETGQDGIRPGVVTSWILHYRARPEQRLEWYERIARVLDPRFLGVGLSSVIFTREDEIQLGFGGSVSLLDNLVQLGGGYNLNTEQPYWLLSTPLLDLLERFRGNSENASVRAGR